MSVGQTFIRYWGKERNRLFVQRGVLQPRNKRMALRVLFATASGSSRRSGAQWENIYFRQVIPPLSVTKFSSKALSWLVCICLIRRGCAQRGICPMAILLWPCNGCLGSNTRYEHQTRHPHFGCNEWSLVCNWRKSFERSFFFFP